jgi:hypothetical protein
VRQALGEVQSLELHQYNIAISLSTNLIKNKAFCIIRCFLMKF